MNNKGMTLVLILVIMFVLTVSAGGLVTVTTSTRRYAAEIEDRIYAKNYARSGVEIAKSIIARKVPANHEETIEFKNGIAKIQIRKENTVYTVVSTGISDGVEFCLRKKLK